MADEQRPGENMTDSEQLSDDVLEMEQALRTLTPRPSAIDQNQLLFLAGQAAARAERNAAKPEPEIVKPSRGIWPLLTCLSTVLAIGFAAVLFAREEPSPRVVEKIVYVDRPHVGFRQALSNPNQKRIPVKQVDPAPKVIHVIDRNEEPFIGSSLFLTNSSRLLRMRYTALATNADQLPDARLGSDSETTVSYRSLRDEYLEKPKPKTQQNNAWSGLIPWTLPLGQGSQL
jgi:hypothetical protein